MTIKDNNGKTVLAVDVFALSIRALVNYVMECLKSCISTPFEQIEIQWVLTVPAIWADNSNEFMRESAEKVCIGFIKTTSKIKSRSSFIITINGLKTFVFILKQWTTKY